MHQRKQRMAELSEGGFIVLPGGFGTFEEVMEMTTWSQLRIHQRPVVVLNGEYCLLTWPLDCVGRDENLYSRTMVHHPFTPIPVNGFYSPLRDLVERSVAEGFISPVNQSLIKIIDLQPGDDPMSDWGKRGMEALEAWTFDHTAGYQLDWSAEGKPCGRQP